MLLWFSPVTLSLVFTFARLVFLRFPPSPASKVSGCTFPGRSLKTGRLSVSLGRVLSGETPALVSQVGFLPAPTHLFKTRWKFS